MRAGPGRPEAIRRGVRWVATDDGRRRAPCAVGLGPRAVRARSVRALAPPARGPVGSRRVRKASARRSRRGVRHPELAARCRTVPSRGRLDDPPPRRPASGRTSAVGPILAETGSKSSRGAVERSDAKVARSLVRSARPSGEFHGPPHNGRGEGNCTGWHALVAACGSAKGTEFVGRLGPVRGPMDGRREPAHPRPCSGASLGNLLGHPFLRSGVPRKWPVSRPSLILIAHLG